MEDSETATVLGSTQLIEGARALIPDLRTRRLELEELRRLPEATVADLRELGVVGTMLPTEVGGAGLGAGDLFNVSVELGRGCGSTAWCAGNFAIHNHLLTAFPLRGQEEIFAESSSPFIATGFNPSGGTSTRTGEDMTVSGQWQFASGIEQSSWIMIAAMGDAGPLAHLISTDEVQIADNWHTVGLRGTGSKDVKIENVRVPMHRVLSFAEVCEAPGMTRAHELYGLPFARIPLLSVFNTGIVGSILGSALGGIEVFIAETAEKVGLSGKKGSERPDVQSRLGKSIGDMEAALAVARNCYREMEEIGTSDRDATIEERVGWRSRLSWSVRLAHGAIDSLFQAAGANAIRSEDLFGHSFRDCTAGSHHYSIQADTYETARGRLALGLEHDVVGL